MYNAIAIDVEVNEEVEHNSTHIGVPAKMLVNTSSAAHLGIMMETTRDNLEYFSWQNCYA